MTIDAVPITPLMVPIGGKSLISTPTSPTKKKGIWGNGEQSTSAGSPSTMMTTNNHGDNNNNRSSRFTKLSFFKVVRGLVVLGLISLLSLYLMLSNTEGKRYMSTYSTQVYDAASFLIFNTSTASYVPELPRTLSDITASTSEWITSSSSSSLSSSSSSDTITTTTTTATTMAEKTPSEDDAETTTTSTTSGSTVHEPLNVIIFYPDDWRYDDIGDEHPVLKTPFFTQLAKDGIRFTHSAVTTAICWISRATLFTGQHVAQHASTYLFRPTFANTPERWQHTWPYLLQKAGYYVAHVGKWQYQNKDNYLHRLFNYSIFYDGQLWWPWYNKTHIHATDRCTYDALRFLREIKPNNTPFALTVAFYPPKGNVDADYVVKESLHQYRHAFFPEPYNITHAYEVLPYFLRDNQTEARKRYLFRFGREQSYQTGMKAYYAMISHIDAACQEVIDEVKRQGLYEKTMIIVTADHGEFHGSHALADKWYPYQESIRVPLIIHDPRIPRKKRGIVDHSMTLNIDLAETILGAAGLPADPVMQGRDMADLYLREDDNDDDVCTVDSEQCQKDSHDHRNATTGTGVQKTYKRNRAPWRTEFFYQFPMINGIIPQSTAVVRKDWKYTFWRDYNYEQLFNIAYDPMEMNDLINHTEFTDILQEMRKAHRRLELETYAPGIPYTRCDSIWPAGTDYSKMPRCHCLPDEPETICCCPYTPAELEEQEKQRQLFELNNTT